MQIITPTADHVPALAQLAAQTFSETFAHLYPIEDLQAFLRKSYGHDALTTEIAQPGQFWRMLVDDTGAGVAYLQCGPVSLPHLEADPSRQGEIKRLYVRQTMQGKGLGRQFMTMALDWLKERYGDAPQWIGVWSENHKAQALYGSYGFQRVGEYQFPVGSTLDDEFILRRNP